MDAGVSDAVAVIYPLTNRVLKRSGNAPYDYLGKAKPMGKVKAMAGLLDCSIERTERLRERSDMRGDVFLDEKTAIVRFGDNSKKDLAASDAIRTYLSEQLQSADTLDELHATLKLISEIEK